MASQAGRQSVTQAGSSLPGDSASFQVGSSVNPNNTPARESPSQAGSSPLSIQAGSQATTQAGSQAINYLPGDSTSSQAGSAVTPYTPAREGPFQAGNNPPSNQAGSQVTGSGRQVTRCSTRHGALQASQGNSRNSQADSASPWEGNPPPNSQTVFPKGLPQKTLTQSGSSTYPANLCPQHKGLF